MLKVCISLMAGQIQEWDPEGVSTAKMLLMFRHFQATDE